MISAAGAYFVFEVPDTTRALAHGDYTVVWEEHTCYFTPATLRYCLERAGLEVRDVESLREHYALTLRRWVANLEAHREEAVRLVGEGRYRVWRLYIAASARRFEAGQIEVHQVLAVRPDGGRSGLPLRRADIVIP